MCYITWIAGMDPALGVGVANAILLQANSKFARESQRTAIEAQDQFS
ncbi:cytochrome bd-I oxidase subunit CydX [Paraburkholderia strydomiana]|nr:cytochrome bd-I oxidase subunit CydX [Paraburkholderia strydomiana]MBT2794521.1 cytochrome bd-I oxidase subunit CydX [Paraburkholderia strydomiana]